MKMNNENHELNSDAKQMVNRLKRAEGQIRGVIKLVEEGADCELILQQLKATRIALDAATRKIIANFMHKCYSQDKSKLEKAIELLMKY